MIVTTTSAIQGRPAKSYLGIVTGEVIVGANIFRDMFASITDIVGGRSGKYENVLARARGEALAEMEEAARKLGGNAVVGVDIDYEVLGEKGSMLMVCVSGTAVTTSYRERPPERDLNSDAYRLWLAEKYGIARNDIFNQYVAGGLMFTTVEGALHHVHDLDVARVEQIYGSGAYPFREAELSVYGERQLRALEAVFVNGNSQNQREVVETICRKIGWEAGDGDELAFLEAFYAALREYLADNGEPIDAD